MRVAELERDYAVARLTYEAWLLRALPFELAIVAMDRDWRVVVWNHAAERLYGWTVVEAVGRHASEVVRLDLSDSQRVEIRRETRERGQWQGDVVAFRKDGNPLEIELTTVEVRGGRGELIGFAETHRELTGYNGPRPDIGDHKQASAELRVHASLLDNVEDAVIATDADEFRVTAWNRGAERLYGFTAREALGRPARELASTAGYEVELEMERELVETGRTRMEFRGNRKDGSPVDVELIAVAVKDERGEINGYLGIHRDITERKQMYKRLEEARELERTRIARAIHDDALQGLSDALILAAGATSGAPVPASASAGQLVDILRRVGEQLRSAIYDLRLGAEEDTPFPELLSELVELHREMAVGPTEIESDLGAGVPSDSLGGRGIEILRIVGEALTNARRHSGSRLIRVRAHGTNGMLGVEVSDDGRGFDPASRPSSTRLGITGMYERAQLLGAQLEIDSQPGGGTTVRLEVSLRDGHVAGG